MKDLWVHIDGDFMWITEKGWGFGYISSYKYNKLSIINNGTLHYEMTDV